MNTVRRRRIPRPYTLLYTTKNTSLESSAEPVQVQRVTYRRNSPYPPTEAQTRPWQRHEACETPRRNPPYPPTQPQTRHEAHEGTTALNVPFNLLEEARVAIHQAAAASRSRGFPF